MLVSFLKCGARCAQDPAKSWHAVDVIGGLTEIAAITGASEGDTHKAADWAPRVTTA